MFDFSTVIPAPDAEPETTETISDPEPMDPVDPITNPKPEPKPDELPPGMILIDGHFVPPYNFTRNKVKERCRWIESEYNAELEADGNCYVILLMKQCTTETITEISYVEDSAQENWFSVLKEEVTEETLRMVTICDGVIKKIEDPPDDWEPPEDDASEDDSTETHPADPNAAPATGTATTPAEDVDDPGLEPERPPEGTTPETREQREQRKRRNAARRILGRLKPRPDTPPTGFGHTQPPPTKTDDGRWLWRPVPIIVDVAHAYFERTTDKIVWYCWVLTSVRREGCEWVAVYTSFKITFVLEPAAERKTTVELDTRAEVTRRQPIPECQPGRVAFRGDSLFRTSGGAVRLVGNVRTAAPTPVEVAIRAHDGTELLRREVLPRADGTFELDFDASAIVGVDDELIVETPRPGAAELDRARIRVGPPGANPFVASDPRWVEPDPH